MITVSCSSGSTSSRSDRYPEMASVSITPPAYPASQGLAFSHQLLAGIFWLAGPGEFPLSENEKLKAKGW